VYTGGRRINVARVQTHRHHRTILEGSAERLSRARLTAFAQRARVQPLAAVGEEQQTGDHDRDALWRAPASISGVSCTSWRSADAAILLIEEPHREPERRDGKEECAGESHSRNESRHALILPNDRVAALDAIAPNVTCVVSRNGRASRKCCGRGAAFAHTPLRAHAARSSARIRVRGDTCRRRAPSRAHEYAVPSTPATTPA